jgi:hypothetical protein
MVNKNLLGGNRRSIFHKFNTTKFFLLFPSEIHTSFSASRLAEIPHVSPPRPNPPGARTPQAARGLPFTSEHAEAAGTIRIKSSWPPHVVLPSGCD